MDEYSSPRESWVTARKDVRHSAAKLEKQSCVVAALTSPDSRYTAVGARGEKQQGTIHSGVH